MIHVTRSYCHCSPVEVCEQHRNQYSILSTSTKRLFTNFKLYLFTSLIFPNNSQEKKIQESFQMLVMQYLAHEKKSFDNISIYCLSEKIVWKIRYETSTLHEETEKSTM